MGTEGGHGQIQRQTRSGWRDTPPLPSQLVGCGQQPDKTESLQSARPQVSMNPKVNGQLGEKLQAQEQGTGPDSQPPATGCWSLGELPGRAQRTNSRQLPGYTDSS